MNIGAYVTTLLFIICACLPITTVRGQEQAEYAFSETIVKGVVVDEKGVPMQYAAISVSHVSSPTIPTKGTLTSSNGGFQLKLPAGNDFLVSARFLGYRDTVSRIKTNVDTLDLGKLRLYIESQLIEGVTVKPPITVTADRIIFNFEHDKDREKSNMMKMIRKMPLILVDDFTGRIYVESREKTYVILRNGKLDALFSNNAVTFEQMLEKLPAMGFTQFEIWQKPPLRYQRYDYVINIITDKTRKLIGAVGSSAASYDFDQGQLSLKQGFTGSADKLRFAGGFRFSNQHSPKNETSQHTKYYATEEAPEILINQLEKNRNNSQQYTGDVKISYDLSEKQLLNIDASYYRSPRNRKHNLLTDSVTNDISFRSNRQTVDDMKNSALNLGMAYQYDFISNTRILNLSYLFSHKPYRNDQVITETKENETGREYTTGKLNETKENAHRLQMDYTDVYFDNNLSLNLGAGYLIQNYDDNSFSYSPQQENSDNNLTVGLLQNLHRIDGYAELKWNPTDKLSFNARIIADYLPDYNKTKLTYIDRVEDVVRSGLLLSPEFSFRYMFNMPTSGRNTDYMQALFSKSSLDLSYRQTGSRPTPRQMSTYTDMSNPNHIVRGNPNLKADLYHDLNLRLSLSLPHNIRISPSIGYGWTDNKIIPNTFTEVVDSRQRLVNTYINTKSDGYNLHLHMSYKLKWLIWGMYSKYNTYIPNEKSSNSLLSLNGRYDFDGLKFVRIGAMVNYNKTFNQGARGMQNSHPLGINLLLTPKRFKIKNNYLSSSISFNNILNWNKSERSQFLYTKAAEYESVYHTRTMPIAINIEYSFGRFITKPLRSARKKASIEGFSKE